MQKTSLQKAFATVGALLAAAAVIIQFWLALQNRAASVPETIVRFFSFFTVLTNSLVAICFTAVAARGISNKLFFARPSTLAATAGYILVVGLVYQLVLRATWHPQGLQKWVDEALHTVNPVYYFLFWLLFVPKNALKWSGVFPWLVYPGVYLIYVLLRGTASGFYPYPFINVTQLGYSKIAVNAAVLLLVFLFFFCLMVGIAKLSGKRTYNA